MNLKRLPVARPNRGASNISPPQVTAFDQVQNLSWRSPLKLARLSLDASSWMKDKIRK